MAMFTVLVIVGVALTMVLGVVVAFLLALGARTSKQDLSIEPLESSARLDPEPSVAKENQ